MSGDYFRVVYYLGGKRLRLVFISLAEAKAEAEAKASHWPVATWTPRNLSGRTDSFTVEPGGDPFLGNSARRRSARICGCPKNTGQTTPFRTRCDSSFATMGTEFNVFPSQMPFRRFLDDKAARGLTKVYLDDLRNRLRGFEKVFHCDLNHITREDVRSFLSRLKVAARSYNNFIRTLKTFFRYSQTRGWISKNSISLKESRTERRRRSPSKFSNHGKWNDSWLRVPPPRRLLGTGRICRRPDGGNSRMTWEDVYRREGFVEVEAQKAKTARRRLVPISANLQIG